MLGVILLILLGAFIAFVAFIAIYLYVRTSSHPSNPPDSDSLLPAAQHEIKQETDATPFLRNNSLISGGGLREPGWAKQLPWEFHRKDARFLAPLVKEWDYYCVINKSCALCFTVADMGYVGSLSCSVVWGLDTESPIECTETLIAPGTFGRWNLPGTTKKGQTKGTIKNAFMCFNVVEATKDDGKKCFQRTLTVEWPDFGKTKEEYMNSVGLGITASLTLEQSPDDDTIVVNTPFGNWPNDSFLFYYNQKINAIPASGTATVGKTQLNFEKKENSDVDSDAYGCLDWGRGLWPYSSDWIWCSGHGSCAQNDGSKHRVALNLGFGFGNCATHTENSVFYDGKIVKLGRLRADFSKEDFTKNWVFKDEEHKLSLTFTPKLDRFAPTQVVVISMIAHQVFGTFEGTLVDEESGLNIKISNIPGWCEYVKNKW